MRRRHEKSEKAKMNKDGPLSFRFPFSKARAEVKGMLGTKSKNKKRNTRDFCFAFTFPPLLFLLLSLSLSPAPKDTPEKSLKIQ